jgi:hypothetical protein
MTSESPIKRLLTGNLDVLKNDDPSLISDFLESFQGVEINNTAVFSMLFMRACHFDSVKIAKHMLNNNLIPDINAHEQGAMRAALRNDSLDLMSLLLDRGAKQEISETHCLTEACTQGAISCIKQLIHRARLGMDAGNFSELLDKSTAELIKNSGGRSPERIIEALITMKEEGASMSGKRENLLAIAVLANRNIDMLPVVKFLVQEGQGESAYRSAKSALQTLITQSESRERLNNLQSPHDMIRELRTAIESARPRAATTQAVGATRTTTGSVPGL